MTTTNLTKFWKKWGIESKKASSRIDFQKLRYKGDMLFINMPLKRKFDALFAIFRKFKKTLTDEDTCGILER